KQSINQRDPKHLKTIISKYLPHRTLASGKSTPAGTRFHQMPCFCSSSMVEKWYSYPSARIYLGGACGNGFVCSKPNTGLLPVNRQRMKLMNQRFSRKSLKAANHICQSSRG